eukprot:1039982-Amphidinium_carterae.1
MIPPVGNNSAPDGSIIVITNNDSHGLQYHHLEAACSSPQKKLWGYSVARYTFIMHGPPCLVLTASPRAASTADAFLASSSARSFFFNLLIALVLFAPCVRCSRLSAPKPVGP